MPKPVKIKRINYLSNAYMLEKFKEAKLKNEITKELSSIFFLLVNKISQKHNFSRYSYLDDMRSNAIEHLVVGWYKFNPLKSENIFSYYTQIVINAFTQVLNNEKNHQKIRDSLYISQGLDPSFNYDIE